MKDAILVERDYKGQYERFALTPKEFEKEFSQHLKEGMPEPKEIGSSYTLSSLVHVWYTAVEVGDERWNQFFTDMKWMLPESDIEAGNLAYIREDLFQSLKEYLSESIKYPHLSSATDFEYLKENLSEVALAELEGILDAYDKDRIDFELKKDPSGFTAEFCLIINNKEYRETGLEAVALQWSEAMESTEHLVECFKDAFEYNTYQFTIHYSENGVSKDYEISITESEKPDSKWLAQAINDCVFAHYNGSIEDAVSSVDSIDVLIEDENGEYVDSDEICGDDLKALFEHLKVERYISNSVNSDYMDAETVTGYVGQILDECEIDEKARGLLSELYNEALKVLNGENIEKDEKPGLDVVISAARQRQDNISDKIIPGVEPER